MKNCVSCGAQMSDTQSFCTVCGAQQPSPATAPVYQSAAPADPFDHTAEFDPRDISDNKCFAMLIYLLGTVGIIIALLASKDSPYLKFHIRQAIKLTVCAILVSFAAIVPFIGWIVAAVCCVIIFVLKIIAFFSICSGKAQEPAIIKNIDFLK